MARALIGAVLGWNLQCALAFITFPTHYSPAFGIPDPTGYVIIRGFGLLFLMWNVPYGFALAHPVRHRTSLIEAIIMQGIGLLGESGLWLFGGSRSLPESGVIERFIWFDGIGLVFLMAALLVVFKQGSKG